MTRAGENEPELGGTSPNWGGERAQIGRNKLFLRSNLIAVPLPHTPAQRSDLDGFSRILTNPLPLHGGPATNPPPPAPEFPSRTNSLPGEGIFHQGKAS